MEKNILFRIVMVLLCVGMTALSLFFLGICTWHSLRGFGILTIPNPTGRWNGDEYVGSLALALVTLCIALLLGALAALLAYYSTREHELSDNKSAVTNGAELLKVGI